MGTEYVIWGLPAGKTDKLDEVILSTQCTTKAELERIYDLAAANGYHSLHTEIVDLATPPDFIGALNLLARKAAH